MLLTGPPGPNRASIHGIRVAFLENFTEFYIVSLVPQKSALMSVAPRVSKGTEGPALVLAEQSAALRRCDPTGSKSSACSSRLRSYQ